MTAPRVAYTWDFDCTPTVVCTTSEVSTMDELAFRVCCATPSTRMRPEAAVFRSGDQYVVIVPVEGVFPYSDGLTPVETLEKLLPADYFEVVA